MGKITMKNILVTFLVIGFSAVVEGAEGQAYPEKPIHLVVGFAPGGGADINARLLAPKLSEYLGQQVVVENRPGAGTNIANDYVAKAAADGYTLLLNTAAVAINMSLYKKLGFDTLRDFAPVSIFSSGPNILAVHPSIRANDIKELVNVAKSRPGALSFSSAGSGTTQHLAGELFKLRTGIDMVHVPYKGSSPSLTALISGEVGLTFISVPPIIQHIKAGRVRAIASTGSQRSKLMPDLPTMKEAGVEGVEVSVWYGVLGPVNITRNIVNNLAQAIKKAAYSDDIKQRLMEQGTEPVGNTPDEFGKILRVEVKQWAEVVKASGAQPN